MATQYTPILQLALPVTGEINGTWGDVVNDNITSMVEQAIAGMATISTWTTNSHTLTTANGTTDEARCAMLVAATGAGGTALTGAGEIICPARTKLFVMSNTSAYTVTLKTAAGSGVAVPAGDTTFLFCDGTNVNACVTQIVNGHITGNLTVDGNTTLGNTTSDTITATARIASDLNPSADNTYDLGTSGNSWRNLYIDGTATIATLNVTTIDTTNIEVTNIKAKDGTAAITLADSTGVATLSAAPVLNAGTANQVQYLNGSKQLVGDADFTFDGTTLSATNITSSGSVTLSGGTANGVAYLNGSKVLTTGSALTFDGANLSTAGAFISVGAGDRVTLVNQSAGSGGLLVAANNTGSAYAPITIDGLNARFNVAGSEQMRLTSTGLGIGTSSPGAALDVSKASGTMFLRDGTTGNASLFFTAAGTGYAEIQAAAYGVNFNKDLVLQRQGGNLGLGVTPSAWGSGWKSLEFSGGNAFASAGAQALLSQNLYNNGSNWIYKASAAGALYQANGGVHYWYNAPSGTAGNAASLTQAMTLDASGNLGIGTSSPADKLEVSGTIRVSGSGSASGDNAQFYNASGFGPTINGYNFAIRTGASTTSERMRIDSSGNLLVGTTSGQDASGEGIKIRPNGDGSGMPRISIVTNATLSGQNYGISYYSTGAGAYRFYVTSAGTIAATVTSITAISDASLKENIRDLETGLSEVLALKPRRFDWKEEACIDDKNVAGFIAQELEQVLPELVYDYKYNDTETKKSIKMGDILPTLVKAIQELKAELDATKAEVVALKGA